MKVCFKNKTKGLQSSNKHNPIRKYLAPKRLGVKGPQLCWHNSTETFQSPRGYGPKASTVAKETVHFQTGVGLKVEHSSTETVQSTKGYELKAK